MNSNFTYSNGKLRITKLLRSSSGILRNSALSLSLFILFTFFSTNSLLAQCGAIVTQPEISFDISLDGLGMATVVGGTPQVSSNISPIPAEDPPCSIYVFYESDGTTLIGTSISLDCTDEGVETTYVVRIAENGAGLNASLNFLTIHVTPLDTELPTWDPAPGALDAMLECDMVDAYVVDILAIPLLTASDNCAPPPPIVSVLTDMTFPGICPHSYTRIIEYTAIDNAGNVVAAPYTVTIDSDDTTPPDWFTAPGSLDVLVECSDVAGLAAAQALSPTPIDNCSAEMDITVMKIAGPFMPVGCGTSGFYVNEFTIVDECGNPGPSFFQTIAIVDTEAPTSTQPDITVSALGPPDCDAPVVLTLTSLNTMDNCDPFGAIMIVNDGGGIGVGNGLADASGDYPIGTTTVSFSLTDDCGNNSVHMVDVTVIDDLPPDIVYMDIVHMNNTTAGDCSNIFGWTRPFDGPPDAFDCSGPLTVTETIAGPDPGAIMGAIGPYVPGTPVIADFPVGVTTITYTFTDTEGNMDTRTVTVTITDNELPVAVCQDITVQLDASGNASITGAMIDGGSTDNCGIMTLAASPSTFTCADVGVNPVTLTVTDINGNVSSPVCVAMVTVEDNVPPIALCQNINVPLDAAGNATITAAQIDNGSSDACGIASLMIDVSMFDCTDVGANNVNLTVTDNNGNVSVCAAVATVVDNVAPVAACQDITVQLDAFGNASITAIQIDNGSSDACGIASLSVAPNSFTCANTGPNPVILTVTDNNGNVATCNATVTVEDNVAPIALCQDITVQLDGSNMASIVGADVDNGSNDACGIGMLSVSPNTFDCSDVGANNVTLTVTDNNGNVAMCAAVVTVEDIIPPTIVCPTATMTIPDFTTGTFTGPSAIPDNCNPGLLEETISITVPAGSTITDLNISLQIEHSWVGDLNAELESPSGTIIPFFHRPGTTSGSCMTNFGFGCGADDLDVTFDDESANTYIDFENTCNGTSPAIFGDFMPQSPFSSFDGEDPQGTWLIRIQDNAAADIGSLLSATIDIAYEYDIIGNDLSRDTDPGSCDYTAVGNEFDPLSWDDNCPPAVITHNYPGAPNPNTLDGAVFPPGQTNITWTVTDGSGNTATCNIAVTVTDNEPPTQTGGQGDGTTISAVAVGCTASVTWTPPTFSDNCPPVTVVSNFAPGFSFPVGTTTVVYTATDLYNNSTIVSFDVEVTDGTPPIAGCQPNPIDLFLDANGEVTLTAFDVNLGSMDNCGNIILFISVDGGPFVASYTFICTELGSHNVILRVSDGLLTDDCAATVNVFDNIIPTAVCQDITVQLNNSGTATINPTQVDNGSTDNALLCLSLSINVSSFDCDDIGDNFVTLTATDAAGNFDDCVATVTVEDNIPPVFSTNPPNPFTPIPGNVTTSCFNIPANNANPFATDNCDTPVIIFNETSTKSGNPNNCLNYSYVITRTWTATDNSSNSTAQSQTITVVDNQAPTSASYNASVSNGGTVSTNPNDCFATITLNMTNLTDCAPFANITVTNDAPHGNGLTSASGNYAIGTYNITFTATDPCGNTSNFNYSFTVFDGVAPVASCVNNLNLGLPSSGTLILSPGAVNNGSYDNCNGTSGIANISVSPDVFTCADVGGPHNVTLTVTDFAGNSSTCNTTINIQENNAPIALCQPASLILGPNGTVSLNASQVNAGSFDDCTPVTLSVFPNTFNQNNLGSNVVTLTVMDGNGNSSTCQALVTVSLPPTCFNIGTVAGGAGNVVSVPVSIEDFTGVVGFQFQLQIMSDADSINWDSIGEFVGVSGIHPDLNNLMEFNLLADTVFTPIDTTYLDEVDGMGNPVYPPLDSIDMITYDTSLFYNNMSVSWLQFNPAGPISLPHGTTIFYIDILLTGNLDDFSVVKIVNPSILTPPEITYSFNSLLYNLVPCWDNGAIFIGELVVAGNIRTENGGNVALADVTLRNANTNGFIASQTTGLDGNFAFTIVNGGSFKIDPSKNINWSNGIDILDVAAIQRHAVNFAFVNSAYKKIAADVNGTNTITTFDAVQLNLYLSSGFLGSPPPGPSWRFADANQMLPNLPNATVPPYTDELTIFNIITDTMMNDFIGIKTGDIAGITADPSTLTGGGAEELSDTDLTFLIENKAVKENESIRIDIRAENFDRLIGYQWVLQFNPEVLSFQGFENGTLGNLGDGNFGEILVEEGKLIMTWYDAYATDIDPKEVLFALNFNTNRKADHLSDLLSLGELTQIEPVAYNEDYKSRDIELEFVEPKDAIGEFALYQNIPNPFKDETVISFNLPEKTFATLSITDITGRLLKKVEGDFAKGYNEINISRSDLPQSGILFYELETTENTATKQMIVIE